MTASYFAAQILTQVFEQSCNDVEEHQTFETGEQQGTYTSKCEDDDLDASIHRRARTTITSWQRQELECLFTKYRYPTFEKVEQLSEQLGLPQYVIKVT